MPNPINVLVTGDLVVDRHIYEGDRLSLRDQSNRGTHQLEELGGAAITHRLIGVVFEKDAEERLRTWKADRRGPEPRPSNCLLGCRLSRPTRRTPLHEGLIGTAAWAPQSQPGSKERHWLLSKAFGYGAREAGRLSHMAIDDSNALESPEELTARPDVLVIDEGGDRFRRIENNAVWHLPEGGRDLPRWIVLKLSGTIGSGGLWDRLMHNQPRERLVVVVPARLLRQHDVRLSRGLSWERSVEHLLNELEHNPAIRPLGKARHLIVTFECDGAVWVDRSGAQTMTARPQLAEVPAQARLDHDTIGVVFDAAHAEGEWASRLNGNAFGFQTCITAAIVQNIASMEDAAAEPDLFSAMERGLAAMRNLRERGHGVAASDTGPWRPGAGFPVQNLAAEILHPTHRFVRASVPPATKRLDGWSIMSSLQHPNTAPRPLFGLARQLTIQGDSLLDHVPHLRIGKAVSAGRQEMETLRSLRRIMVAYRDGNPGKKPLSIGVFGSPGSGKSFAVEQLAVGVFGKAQVSSYEGWMEFNLSQFETPADLIGAFHQVRDRVLQGLVPVVFWDEFDSGRYQWLQFLLAPMQDGRFQAARVTHTLGKCVFVFAGGTAGTFESFGPRAEDPSFADFKLAKGPDFKSRLDGFLNVQGPNPSDARDLFYPVRRALMIRSLLGCAPDERLAIDGGLLTALLEVPEYKYGARSLGKVLEPFAATRKNSREALRRSRLPAPNQLWLHVDADQFHNLCSRDLPFMTEETEAILARHIHETWREIARQEGNQPRYDMPFEELPLEIQRSNVAAARRISEIIALVGLKVESGLASVEEAAVKVHLESHLEALAEEEHRGWMQNAESEGWRFAEIRDDKNHLHDCLRPFHELRESDKDKDRNSVLHFPDFVRAAGFKMAFIGG